MANDPTWTYDFKDALYLNRLIGLDLIPGSGQFRYKEVMVGNIYHPPYPPTPEIWKEEIQDVLKTNYKTREVLHLFGYITKQQIFNNGNKRTALVFCNSLLISKELGFINVPVHKKNEFSKLLMSFYTNKTNEKTFINEINQKWFIKEFEHINLKLKKQMDDSAFSTNASSLEELKKEKQQTPPRDRRQEEGGNR